MATEKGWFVLGSEGEVAVKKKNLKEQDELRKRFKRCEGPMDLGSALRRARVVKRELGIVDAGAGAPGNVET